MIKENIDIRRLKASDLNKKIDDVKLNQRRYASEVDLQGKRRYNQDI